MFWGRIQRWLKELRSKATWLLHKGWGEARLPSGERGVTTEAVREGTLPSPCPPPELAPICLPQRRRRSIIVGLDFGTSSTKAVWHDTTANAYEPFRWSAGGSQALFLPSLIGVYDNSVWYGHEAAGLPDGALRIPWIKICVLCRNKPKICRGCGHSSAPGRVVLRSDLAVSAHVLAAAFLAQAMAVVERYLTERFSEEELILQWNLGCPVDHMDSLVARRSFEQMAWWAWKLRSAVSNPTPIQRFSGMEETLLDTGVPDESERLVHVRPESHAAIMAFLQSPEAEEETYAIVDVGAGTTEISVLLHAKNRADLGQPFTVNYLTDGTIPVGGDDIDRELAGIWGVSLGEAKRRKEHGEPPPRSLKAVQEVFNAYRRLCCEVRFKRLLPVEQCDYNLFVLGGGGRMAALRSKLKQDFPEYGVRLRRIQSLRPPANFALFGEAREQFDLLAVACGLSSTMFWDFRRPSEIDPLPEPAPAERPDCQELYSK